MKRAVLLVWIASSAAAAPTAKECIDANERAIKHRNALELRAARTDLLVCASSSCPGTIQTECSRRLDDVERATPSLVFAADDGAGTDLVDVRVTLDGVLLSQHLDPTSIPIDPGNHTLRFETSGFPPVERSIVVREGEKNRRERAVFARAVSVEHPKPTKGSPMRFVGLGIAGAGILGLGASALFAGLSASAWSSSQQACTSPSSCMDHAKAVSDHDAASAFATVSTIALVSGAALVATGGILFFVSPSPKATVVGVGATF